MKRRVVITGVGALTPFGIGALKNWNSLLEGKSCISPVTRFDVSKLSCRIAGTISGFNPDDYMDPRDSMRVDAFIQYGVAAATDAVENSGLMDTPGLDKERVGVMIGSGIGGLKAIEDSVLQLHHGTGRVSPFFIPSCLINLASGHVSIKYGFMGPNHAVVTACASGAHAICDAAAMIARDDADVMVSGGTESPVVPIGMAGFAAARTLSSKYNDSPTEASRPWDKGRDGFVMSEGAAVVVLEEYEHAKRRGATIYAEILGYGMSGDAYHITSPHPEGRGGILAMNRALQMSSKADGSAVAANIDYLNAHATSTTMGDEIELNAIKQAVYSANNKVRISSTKSSTGHLLGAAGSLEAIITTFALKNKVAPATLNLYDPIDTEVNFVPLYPQDIEVSRANGRLYAMSNSFGFGGTNVSVVLGSI